MIKCTHKKLKKRKKLIIVPFCIIVLILSYLNYVVNPVIIELSQSKVRAMAQKAVSNSIHEVIKDGAIYESLINITRNENGEIVFISSNTIQVNMLTRELVKNAQTKLDVMGQHGIDIPIGSFSGMPIFVGRGPNVNIKLLPIGSISGHFISKFTSAGINQTNHRIYLNVTSDISVILPTNSQIVTTSTQMMICESIIIGKVPDTYLMTTNLGDMMDLIPN